MHTDFYGVCLFDDSKIPGDGWAARPNEPAIRISGIHDLAHDLNWVTNLDYGSFMANGLGAMRHICQSQYFRESVDSLLGDYALGENHEVAAAFLADHFNGTAIFGHSLMGIDPLKVRNNYRYAQHIVNQLNIPLLKQSSRGITQEHSDLICESATQANQAMVGNMKGLLSVHGYFPRLLYFRWLLRQLVPISLDWKKEKFAREEIGYKDGKLVGKNLLLELSRVSEESKVALFFRIAIYSQHKEYSTFGSFGVGKKESREWVTLPELLNLSRYARIQVKETYSLPGGYLRDYIDCLAVLENIPDVSISMGLFMQNLAAAVMAPVNKKETAIGAYLRAYDRVGCFTAAEQLYMLGVMPGSFSMGRIVTKVTPDDVIKAKSAMASRGIIPAGDI
jgi:hypothetical protein